MGAAATLVNFWYDTPPLLGGPAEFEAARRVFQVNGYSYSNLCARLGVERLYQFQAPPAADVFAQPVEDALAVLIRLFCHGLHLRRKVVERFLSVESRAALCALRLLASRSRCAGNGFRAGGCLSVSRRARGERPVLHAVGRDDRSGRRMRFSRRFSTILTIS